MLRERVKWHVCMGRGRGRVTLDCTLGYVDLVVPSAVVRDPLDGARLCERTDNFLVEHADIVCGVVVAVDRDRTVIFSAWL